MDVCKTTVPQLEEITPGHRVACHLVSSVSTPLEKHVVSA
jgi:hypothetical protein